MEKSLLFWDVTLPRVCNLPEEEEEEEEEEEDVVYTAAEAWNQANWNGVDYSTLLMLFDLVLCSYNKTN